MASQAAYQLEKTLGHTGDSVTQQDVTSYPPKEGGSGDTMKALTWQSKNKVTICMNPLALPQVKNMFHADDSPS
jgi:hypothetical protein